MPTFINQYVEQPILNKKSLVINLSHENDCDISVNSSLARYAAHWTRLHIRHIVNITLYKHIALHMLHMTIAVHRAITLYEWTSLYYKRKRFFLIPIQLCTEWERSVSISHFFCTHYFIALPQLGVFHAACTRLCLHTSQYTLAHDFARLVSSYDFENLKKKWCKLKTFSFTLSNSNFNCI